MYYDRGFCRGLVENHIRASYFLVYYLKPLVDNMVRLINCRLGEDEKLEFDISEAFRQEVKNCYYMRNKFFFYFCEKYCEHFQLVSPSSLFDGNLSSLKAVIEYMLPRIPKAFDYPNNNILIDSVEYETSVLRMNWKVVFNESVFFRPVQQNHLLDS